jgi:hypothetical protein
MLDFLLAAADSVTMSSQEHLSVNLRALDETAEHARELLRETRNEALNMTATTKPTTTE